MNRSVLLIGTVGSIPLGAGLTAEWSVNKGAVQRNDSGFSLGSLCPTPSPTCESHYSTGGTVCFPSPSQASLCVVISYNNCRPLCFGNAPLCSFLEELHGNGRLPSLVKKYIKILQKEEMEA